MSARLEAPAMPVSWITANQRHLVAAVERVRRLLDAHATRTVADTAAADGAMRAQARAPGAVPALEALARTCELTPFERDLLALCAGVELDGDMPARCAAAQDDATRPHVTFGLALAAMPDPHWDALTPQRPLRRLGLVELAGDGPLTARPLRITERALHHLAGLSGVDDELAFGSWPLAPPAALAASHAAVAARLARLLARPAPPVAELRGDPELVRDAVATAAAQAGLAVRAVRARDLPADRGLEEWCLRWSREHVLGGPVPLLELDGADPAAAERARDAAERLPGPVLVSAPEPVTRLRRATAAFDLPPSGPRERARVWRTALGDAVPEELLALAAAEFALPPASLEGVGAAVADAAPEDAGRILWDACRTAARTGMEGLAHRVEPRARWEDLILPATQETLLRAVLAQVRTRSIVYEDWGMARSSSRGLGITALFAGPSGTGKTMAAEVLAAELRLDLWHIDLSAVVSKWIGETEKHLRRVFDAAERGGAILLFDEADALFGRRSEVRDSHDRYANIEVGYLLQRMEAYRGLAILTTNQRAALDDAFQRRLRVVVEFPFPGSAEREAIWRRAFPDSVPSRDLDPARLAALEVTGGTIRNIALHAAFLAADAGGPVTMAHLGQAARTELEKIGEPATPAVLEAWA